MKQVEKMIYHLKGWNLEDKALFKKYKAHGFDSVAFYCNGQSMQEIQAQIDSAKEFGLSVDYFHGPLKNNCDIWFENCDDYLGYIYQCLDLARVNKIKYFIMHPSGKECVSFSKIGLKHYKELVKKCEQYGIVLLLENLRMVDSLIYLMEKIRSDNLRVCLDFGHANIWCYNPLDLIRKYKRKILGVHMHDNDGTCGSDQHLIPLQGCIDWKKAIEMLYKYYEGPISLEIDNFKTVDHRYSDIDQYLDDAYNAACQLLQFVK